MTTTPTDPFVAWLNTGTTRREIVPMFGDQAGMAALDELWDERDVLVARLEAMEDEPETSQRATGERSERAKLAAEIKALDDKIDPIEEKVGKSKSVWTIRPLRSDEIDTIDNEHPMPKMPMPTEEQKTTDKGKKRYQGLYDQYVKDSAAVKVDRLMAQLSKAIVSVEMPGGTLDSVSVEHLRTMEQAEYGGQRINLLTKALERAMELEREPSRPFSSSNSESDQE